MIINYNHYRFSIINQNISEIMYYFLKVGASISIIQLVKNGHPQANEKYGIRTEE